MGGKIRHRINWGRSPAKGSLLRRMLKMMLRPEGATINELVEVGLPKAVTGHYMDVLRDEKGWDIRSFRCPPERYLTLKGDGRKTKDAQVYKVVGRVRWSGGYRSLITKVELDDLTNDLQHND